MRARVDCAVLLFLVVCANLLQASKTTPTKLTVIFDINERDAASVLPFVQQEVNNLFLFRDLAIDWRTRSSVQLGEVWSDVVLVKFRGDCRLDATPEPAGDERGPYAWTHVTNGEVLPFSEISCDRVRKNVKSAIHGGAYERADQLMGRALGRVLAHELIHVITGSCEHDQTGVMRHALRPDELVAEHAKLQRVKIRRKTMEPLDVSRVSSSAQKSVPIGTIP
jgi:hypothetical protein